MDKKILSTAIAILMIVTGILVAFSTSRSATSPPPLDRGFSTFEWKDDFLDASQIDANLSSGFVLQNGNISMQYTYPAWIAYPTWQRIRPVYLNNTGTTITDDIIRIVVPYDASMQPDFDDLRFATDTGVPLLYNKILYSSTSSAVVLIKIPSYPMDSPRSTCFTRIQALPTLAPHYSPGPR